MPLFEVELCSFNSIKLVDALVPNISGQAISSLDQGILKQRLRRFDIVKREDSWV
jgi:hypothetical protein